MAQLGTWLISIVTVELLAGLAFAYNRDYGSAVMFLAYAAANLGYFWTKGVFG